MALQVVVEHRQHPIAAVGVQDLDLQQIAREHRLIRIQGIGNVLPRRDSAERQLRQEPDVDEPRVVALDEDDVLVEAAEIVAHERAKGVDVFDLLDGEHVEIHALDSRGDQLPLGRRLACHEAAHVLAELESGRIVERKRGLLFDLGGRHVGFEVEA